MFKWLSLVPDLFGVVKAVEAEVPVTGQGQAKLDAILAAAQGAFVVEQDLQKSWGNQAEFLSAVAKAVGFVVTILNKLGVFKK